MLKQLNLKNIVLIESANIPFEFGFNVISGETGAGKSALMAALKQVQGAKADTQLIRHGYEKGVVEAIFEIDKIPLIQRFLDKLGIDHNPEEELLIRRELCITGKSRAFINHQQVQITVLKRVGNLLFQIVSQHANQQLFQLSHHLEIIDQYGGLNDQKHQYSNLYEKELMAKNKLKELKENEQKRIREIEICQRELNEIEEASLTANEEEELFSEYSKLTNTESLAKISEQIASTLDDQVLPTLHSLKKSSDELISLDRSIKSSLSILESTVIEIQELARVFRNYHNRIEHNPYRVEELNQRLSVINQLKKKYGSTIEDVLKYFNEQKQKLDRLQNAEVEIEKLTSQIFQIEKDCQLLADNLTQSREQAAKKFADAMTRELQTLNMPYARFYVEHRTHERNLLGQDTLEFYFLPNKGEKKIPVKDCASGGETSRILLSLQTLLAGKCEIATLVFDEIDANIGGQTATIVGEKLKQIGSSHQLLCITHFPQVAHCAAHHLQICKKEHNGRTLTTIEVLDDHKKESELLRMTGKF